MSKKLVFGLAFGGMAVMSAIVAVNRRTGDLERRHNTVTDTVRRVAKLATVEMEINDWRLRKDSKELFGFVPVKCEKTVAVFFKGKVAAGFDISAENALTVEVHAAKRVSRAKVRLPPARILYTDVPAPELLVTDGSICNRVDAGDYARLHEEARKAVQEEALAKGILLKAETQARQILTEVVRPMGFAVELEIAPQPLTNVAPM